MNAQNQNFKLSISIFSNFISFLTLLRVSLTLLLLLLLLLQPALVIAFTTPTTTTIHLNTFSTTFITRLERTRTVLTPRPTGTATTKAHVQRLNTILYSTKERDTSINTSSTGTGTGSSKKTIQNDDTVFEDVDGIGGLTSGYIHTLSSSNDHPIQEYIVNAVQQTQTQTQTQLQKSTTTAVEEIVTGNNGNDNVILNVNISNCNTNSNINSNNNDNVTQKIQQELIDPAAIVEAVIGSAFHNTQQQSETTQKIIEKEVQEVVKATTTNANASVSANSIVTTNINNDTTTTNYHDNESHSIDVPNLKKIIKFAIPAIGVWLCSPLLSLIDTSSVGLLSGTTQQAALNPAVAVTDYGALLVAFMYTATTNLVAGARGEEASSSSEGEKPKTKKMLIDALQMSGYVGTILGSVLIAFGPVLLRSIIGNDNIDPNVFAAALRYVRIRALGMPAAVIIGSAQSACIGMQDIKSPMYVLVAAALVNFIGDVIFVPQKSALIGGAAGAAWATVFSQYAALAMFIKWLTSKPEKKEKPLNLTNAILELTGHSKEGKSRRKKFRRALQKLSLTTSTAHHNEGVSSETREDVRMKVQVVAKPEKEFTIRGFLAGRQQDLLKTPTLESAKVFWPYFLPVTATQCGRVSAFVSMIHVVSSALGTMSLAANQVILSIFYCLCPIADSLNLTAQSFVPVIAQRKSSLPRAKALRELTNNFFKIGLLMGAITVGLVNCIPLVSKFFTSDASVIELVNTLVPVLAGTFSVHGIMCAHEGK